jgi:hypothetical protein
MPQSSIIFGALAIGFLVFITTKGRLAMYVNTLWGMSTSSETPSPFTVSTPSLGTGGVTDPTTGSGCIPAGKFWTDIGIGRC